MLAPKLLIIGAERLKDARVEAADSQLRKAEKMLASKRLVIRAASPKKMLAKRERSWRSRKVGRS